jgi:hypothetical protein
MPVWYAENIVSNITNFAPNIIGNRAETKKTVKK